MLISRRSFPAAAAQAGTSRAATKAMRSVLTGSFPSTVSRCIGIARRLDLHMLMRGSAGRLRCGCGLAATLALLRIDIADPRLAAKERLTLGKGRLALALDLRRHVLGDRLDIVRTQRMT